MGLGDTSSQPVPKAPPFLPLGCPLVPCGVHPGGPAPPASAEPPWVQAALRWWDRYPWMFLSPRPQNWRRPSRLVVWLPDALADLRWMQGFLRSSALLLYSRTKDQLLGLVR